MAGLERPALVGREDPRRLEAAVGEQPQPYRDPESLEVEAESGDGPWPELERVLAHLTADQREAIVLKYADDLTYEEMSRITGAGESALKMRVQRAFARLRALLQEVPSV